MKDVTNTITLDPEVTRKCDRIIAEILASEFGSEDQMLIRVIGEATTRLYLSQTNTIHLVFEHPHIDGIRLVCKGSRVFRDA